MRPIIATIVSIMVCITTFWLKYPKFLYGKPYGNVDVASAAIMKKDNLRFSVTMYSVPSAIAER